MFALHFCKSVRVYDAGSRKLGPVYKDDSDAERASTILSTKQTLTGRDSCKEKKRKHNTQNTMCSTSNSLQANGRHSGKSPMASSSTLARQFVRCYWQPSRGFPLLKKHPHLCDEQTRLLLERDACRLLLPACPEERDQSRAFSIICAAALLEMCAGRPAREVRRRVAGLAGTCERTREEHLRRARDIFARIMRVCAAERKARARTAQQAAERARGRHGRRVRVKFHRGGVALNYEQQRDPDRTTTPLETMSLEEASEALRGMSLEDREAALDRMTQVRLK
ncbi:hypothetical protein IF1G_06015 [Cordyceps javanica]|uniref:Uncharacterized protein n=1 Tax=Cordyceps javanica TaxID=43265 RepID=A0A545UZZ2_9HYPO|nr:hypothetical protein IF1G_06015 [Cordyceps javanica]